MKTNGVKFQITDSKVTVFGYPELENRTGTLRGDDMAFFTGKNQELYIANTATGTIRKFSTGGSVLVDDCDIDIETIEKKCKNGIRNARNKVVRYASVGFWDGFNNGVCAISWMLFPEGTYFADSDGLGVEDCNEEEVYAIVDTNLDIIEPFRPINDIAYHLEKLRERLSTI